MRSPVNASTGTAVPLSSSTLGLLPSKNSPLLRCRRCRLPSFTIISLFLNLQVVSEGCKKAVFITTSPFQGAHLSVLKSLVKGSRLEYCVLITSAHVSVHHYLQYGGSKMEGQEMEAFQKLEEDVLLWMGNLVNSFPVNHSD